MTPRQDGFNIFFELLALLSFSEMSDEWLLSRVLAFPSFFVILDWESLISIFIYPSKLRPGRWE